MLYGVPGGMSSRRGDQLGDGMTMGQHFALTRAAAGLPQDERLRRRHCWVIGLADEPGPWPGLILEWERGEDRQWRARVVYLTGDLGQRPGQDGGKQSNEQFMSVQRWVPATHLRPAAGG